MYPCRVASVLQTWPKTVTVITIRICCPRQAQKRALDSQSRYGGKDSCTEFLPRRPGKAAIFTKGVRWQWDCDTWR